MISYLFFTLLAQPVAADFPRVELSQFIEEQQPESLGWVKSDVDFFKVELDPMVHVTIDADGCEILSNGTHFISTPDHDHWQDALIQAGLLTIESSVAKSNNVPLNKRYQQTAVSIMVSNFTALQYNSTGTGISVGEFLYGIDSAIQKWSHGSKTRNKFDAVHAGMSVSYVVVDGDRKSNFNEFCLLALAAPLPNIIAVRNSNCVRIYSQKLQRHWTIAYGSSPDASACTSFDASYTSGEFLCNLDALRDLL